MTERTLELLVERADGRLRLLSPGVGEFTRARAKGELVSAGCDAGSLIVLGRARRLVLPAGVEGRVRNERPERVRQPVGHRALLYELEPVEAGAADAQAEDPAADPALGLVFRAPQSGRFYHSPAPGEPPFVEVGSVLEEGAPIGMIEVMKTFAVLPYRAGRGLPARATVRRLVAPDATDVAEGDPLVELE